MYNYNSSIIYTKQNSLQTTENTGLYIFELLLKDNSHNTHVIRGIKKNNYGNLINKNNNISYNDINKYKLTIIDGNSNNPSIIIKKKLLDSNIYKDNKITLELNNVNNFLEFNYFIK